MSSWLDLLLQPLPLALTWIVLHSLDYGLTLRGAYWFRQKAAEHIDIGGSYELNPIFAKAVDRGARLPKRFLVSLLAVAALFALLSWLAHGGSSGGAPPSRVAEAELELVAGMLLFTRASVITRHVQNIRLYRALALGRAKLTGRIQYDRPTLVRISAANYAAGGVLVLLAAVAAPPSAFLYGGCAGLLGIGLFLLAVARKAQRAAATPAAPPPAAA